MRNVLALLVLVALVLVPSSQAQFNQPFPFEGSSGFTDDLGSLPSLASGAVSYQGQGAQNASLLLGTDGFTVTGLERLCWEDSNGNERCVTETGLSIEAAAGSSVAFRSPEPYDVALEADHTIAFFADASQMFGEDRPEELAFGPSLVGFPVGDTIQLSGIGPLDTPPVTSYSSFNDAINDLALLITLADDSTFTLRSADGTLDTLEGNGQWVGFQGTPAFTPFHADVAALPMPPGATASFSRATDEAAQEGLSAEHLSEALGGIAASEGEGDAQDLGPITDIADLLAGVLNGAYVELNGVQLEGGGSPAEALQSLTVIRFTQMEASRTDGEVAYEGEAALQIQEGEVVGAKPLVGGFVPVLGIVLWGLALAFFILRVALKPKKSNPLWSKLQMVGWIGGPLASIIVFFLWDNAMANLWGASILTAGASGVALGAIAALQLIPLILAGLFFGLPSRIIIKSGVRLAGQGRMMNLHWIIAPFLTLLFGLPLLLSLLATVLDMVGGA